MSTTKSRGGGRKQPSTTKQPESKYPSPFDKAPASLLPFLACLDRAQVYISHIDRHRTETKKQVFLFAVLINTGIAALLAWRIYHAVPTYFALLQTSVGQRSSATVDTANTTRGDQVGILFKRTAMMVMDFLLFRLVGPWPLSFFLERPANPVTWRWKVGFSTEEVAVRVCRNWKGEDMMAGTKRGDQSPFFKTRVQPAISKESLGKTAYLTMDGSWDLDFDVMQAAHSLVKKDEVKMEDLDGVVLAFQDGVGWLAWRFEGTRGQGGDVGVEFRKAMESAEGS